METLSAWSSHCPAPSGDKDLHFNKPASTMKFGWCDAYLWKQKLASC